MTERLGYFYLWKSDKDGLYYLSKHSANGDKIATTEGYRHKRYGAIRAAELLAEGVYDPEQSCIVIWGPAASRRAIELRDYTPRGRGRIAQPSRYRGRVRALNDWSDAAELRYSARWDAG